jgi:hypothetical protein
LWGRRELARPPLRNSPALLHNGLPAHSATVDCPYPALLKDKMTSGAPWRNQRASRPSRRLSRWLRTLRRNRCFSVEMRRRKGRDCERHGPSETSRSAWPCGEKQSALPCGLAIGACIVPKRGAQTASARVPPGSTMGTKRRRCTPHSKDFALPGEDWLRTVPGRPANRGIQSDFERLGGGSRPASATFPWRLRRPELRWCIAAAGRSLLSLREGGRTPEEARQVLSHSNRRL